MDFDINRLRHGEKIAAASGVALFIFMFFFKWYGVTGRLGALINVTGFSASVDAWHGLSTVRWFLLLAVIVSVGAAFVTATQRTVALPVAASVLTAAVGILASLLALFRVVIDRPGPHDLIGTKVGAYLGLLSCIGIAVGGWLAMRDENTSFAQAGAQLDERFGGVGRGPTRPAPPAEGEGSSAPDVPDHESGEPPASAGGAAGSTPPEG